MVLRDTESRLVVFCVCLDRWERSGRLPRETIHSKRGGESPVSQPKELCDQKISPFASAFCSFHSFNDKI